MLRFLGDMVIGWIIFTDSGKKVANMLVDKTYKHVKKNALQSDQFKELLSFKDIFIKDTNNDESISNDGTKDRQNISRNS